MCPPLCAVWLVVLLDGMAWGLCAAVLVCALLGMLMPPLSIPGMSVSDMSIPDISIVSSGCARGLAFGVLAVGTGAVVLGAVGCGAAAIGMAACVCCGAEAPCAAPGAAGRVAIGVWGGIAMPGMPCMVCMLWPGCIVPIPISTIVRTGRGSKGGMGADIPARGASVPRAKPVLSSLWAKMV